MVDNFDRTVLRDYWELEAEIETKRTFHTLGRSEKKTTKDDIDQQCRILVHLHKIAKTDPRLMGATYDDTRS